MGVNQAYNFVEVDENIHTAGLLSEEQLGQLAAEGYQAVINLLPDDSEYAIKTEADIVSQQGLAYEYIPVDYSAPGVEDFQQFSVAMEKWAGNKIIVHCAANYRVSAFYAIYACRSGNWSPDEARAFIAKLWNPSEFPAWESFIDTLLVQPA